MRELILLVALAVSVLVAGPYESSDTPPARPVPRPELMPLSTPMPFNETEFILELAPTPPAPWSPLPTPTAFWSD